MNVRPSALALTPLLVFLALFFGAGLYFTAHGNEMGFYQLHAPVAILPALALGPVSYTHLDVYKRQLPMFAELVVEGAAAAMPAETEVATCVEIVVGDVVIRVGANADEVLLTRSIRAVRAAAT